MIDIEQVEKVLQAAIDTHIFPGCAVGIYNDGKTYIITAGNHTYDKASPQITDDTLYDVASVTKAIPVSSLALKLLNDGKISLEDKLIDYVPEFIGSYREMIRIEHLLTHTLHFDFRLSDSKDLNNFQILGKILSAKLKNEPGKHFFYANATSILLGMVIERCYRKTLAQAAQEVFFEPLGMIDSVFETRNYPLQRIAPTEMDPWRGRLMQGEVHDESAWALRPKIVGSAGLFSTVPDLLKFVQMLLNGGVYMGKRFFKPEIIKAMHTNQRGSADERTGLGWELNQSSFMGTAHSSDAFGKTGFTGCSVLIEPHKNTGLVLLSNHIYPRRRENRDAINRIRCELANCVLKKL